MKTLVLAFVTFATVSAFAQDISIRIAGRGGHVCSAQAMLTDAPVLARGESRREAQVLAKMECERATPDHAFFCEVKECEKDKSKNNVDVAFDVINGEAGMEINFQGKASYICQVSAFSKTYAAKAPTMVEAKVLTANSCAKDRGDAFFCKADSDDCSKLSGAAGGIRIGDIFDL